MTMSKNEKPEEKLVVKITDGGYVAALNNPKDKNGFRIEITKAEVLSKGKILGTFNTIGTVIGPKQIRVRINIFSKAEEYSIDQVNLIDGVSGVVFCTVKRKDGGVIDYVNPAKRTVLSWNLTFDTFDADTVTIIENNSQDLALSALEAHIDEVEAHPQYLKKTNISHKVDGTDQEKVASEYAVGLLGLNLSAQGFGTRVKVVSLEYLFNNPRVGFYYTTDTDPNYIEMTPERRAAAHVLVQPMPTKDDTSKYIRLLWSYSHQSQTTYEIRKVDGVWQPPTRLVSEHPETGVEINALKVNKTATLPAQTELGTSLGDDGNGYSSIILHNESVEEDTLGRKWWFETDPAGRLRIKARKKEYVSGEQQIYTFESDGSFHATHVRASGEISAQGNMGTDGTLRVGSTLNCGGNGYFASSVFARAAQYCGFFAEATSIAGSTPGSRIYFTNQNGVGMVVTGRHDGVATGQFTASFPKKSGTVSLTNDLPTALKSNNGWFKCNYTGIIIQWGKTPTLKVDAQHTISFPIAFPNACFSATATPNRPQITSGLNAPSLNIMSRTYMHINNDWITSKNDCAFYWMAVGY